LPSAAGIYLFFGDAGCLMPLYIGKSINIRARVLSHLREPSERHMMAQAQRVEWVRTAGEIGALLLESQLIKERQPLYNKRLRRVRDLCSWQVSGGAAAGRPQLVFSRDMDFANSGDLYGLHTSAFAAKQALQEMAKAHRLCGLALGLEAKSARGCFGLQIGHCQGVCVGREDAAVHAQRVMAALQDDAVQRWMHPGAVGIVERDGGWTQTHVVRHWRYEGSFEGDASSRVATRGERSCFDLDTYRILVGPLLTGRCELVALA
jgi:excinuclease Cho